MDDQDLIGQLLGGLRVSFTPFITFYTFATRDNDLSLDDFQAELLSFEAQLDNQHQKSADTHYAFATSKVKVLNFPKKSQKPGLNPPFRQKGVSASSNV